MGLRPRPTKADLDALHARLDEHYTLLDAVSIHHRQLAAEAADRDEAAARQLRSVLDALDVIGADETEKARLRDRAAELEAECKALDDEVRALRRAPGEAAPVPAGGPETGSPVIKPARARKPAPSAGT